MIQTENRNTTVISVIGLPQCDIPYYLTRLINSTGEKVLLVDNSPDCEIFNAIRKPKGDTTAVLGNIVVVNNRCYSESFYRQFNYVIVFHGFNVNKQINENSDIRMIETDYSQFTTSKIKSAIAQSKDLPYHIIYRNKISNKIGEKLILKELDISEPVSEYILSYSDIDYMCYLNLIRNGSQQLKGTSADMKEFFKGIMPVLYPELDKKAINKQYKKALTSKIR